MLALSKKDKERIEQYVEDVTPYHSFENKSLFPNTGTKRTREESRDCKIQGGDAKLVEETEKVLALSRRTRRRSSST